MATFFGESIVNVVSHTATGGNTYTVPAGQYARVTVLGGSFSPGGNQILTIGGFQIAACSGAAGFTINNISNQDDKDAAYAIIGNTLFLAAGQTIDNQIFFVGGTISVRFSIALFNLP